MSEALDLELTDGQIASLVTKCGEEGGVPCKYAIKKWRDLIADDPFWYPNKTQENREKPGPKRLRTEDKEAAMAEGAMSIKASGREPTASIVKRDFRDACMNPKTMKVFTDKYILEVFRTKCFDPGSGIPWAQLYPLQKTALPQPLMDMRVAWGRSELEKGNGGGWYHRHVVWVDPSYNILSTSERQNFDMEKALGGKRKRWASEDCLEYSRNQRGSNHAGKQKQKGDRKVWWFIVLARGKVHVEVMGGSFKQTGVDMATMVGRLPKILRNMVGPDAALPRIVMSDRGPGFFNNMTGHIVRAYGEALVDNGFRPFAGEDASNQPPDVPDLLLHETAVGWIRNYLRNHPFDRSGSLDDQERILRKLLKQCTTHINAKYDVDGLCYRFPARLQEMIDKGGGRLRN